MLRLLPQLESTPPLYYCVAWVWAASSDSVAAGLKSLSALCGTLTIPIAYLSGPQASRQLALGADRGGADRLQPIADLVLAGGAGVLDARAVLGLHAARLRIRAAATAAGGVALWALACALALLTHYYAVIVVVPETAWLLYEHRHSRALQVGDRCVVLVGAALTPLAIRQDGTHSNRWIAHSSYLLRLRQVPALFLIGPETHVRELLKFTPSRWSRSRSCCWCWRSRRRERQAALLPGGLALAGFLLECDAGAQHAAGPQPAADLVSGVDLPGRRPGRRPRARCRYRCDRGALRDRDHCGVISVDTTYAFQRPNWRLSPTRSDRGRERRAARHATGDRRVQDNPGPLPLELYLKDLRYIESPTLHRIVEIDVVAALPHKGLGGFCWWGSECNLVPSRLDRDYELPGFHVVAAHACRGLPHPRAARGEADHCVRARAPGGSRERASRTSSGSGHGGVRGRAARRAA